jgi:hypothetical protein
MHVVNALTSTTAVIMQFVNARTAATGVNDPPVEVP